MNATRRRQRAIRFPTVLLFLALAALPAEVTLAQAAAALDVDLPPAITGQPTNSSVLIGQPAALSVVATGSPPLTYRWRKDGLELPDATNASYAIANVQFADAGVYSVVITNLSGSTTSSNAVLMVFDFSTIKLLGSPLDGASPYATLTQARDGQLYGTTYGGGTNGRGTIFKLNTDGSDYAILRSFDPAQGDGFDTWATPIEGSDGALYGTTQSSVSNAGTVFRINKDGSGYGVLRSFTSGNGDGSFPYHGVIEGSDGTLYGTTFAGGSNNMGTVFRLNKDASDYRILRTFTTNAPDGRNPWSSLVEGNDGLLYGTTYSGGSNGSGIIFRLRHDGSNYIVLHHFGAAANNEGGLPTAPLMLASDGMFYGTTAGGGTRGAGVVYTLSPDGSGYRELHHFTAGAGESTNPSDGDGGLVEATDGALYGTTVNGGGAIFKVEKDGSGYIVVYRFTGAHGEGSTPRAALRQGTDGALYGATTTGGSLGGGSLFKLSVPPTPLTARRQPLSQTISAGLDATWTALAASSFPPVTYQWQFNGVDVNGATAPSFTVTNVQPEQAGEYTVVFSDSFESITSAPAILTVVLRPVITQPPQDLTAAQGASVTLAVTAVSGLPPITYQWRRNDGDLLNETNASLNLNPVRLVDSGDYTVVVFDSRGSITSSAATMTVYNNFVWRYSAFTGTLSSGLDTNFLLWLGAAGDAYVDDVVLVTGTEAEAGPNLLRNGGFEFPLSASPLDGWTPIGNHSSSVIETQFGHQGNASLHLLATGAGSPSSAVRQDIAPRDTNTVVTVSFWFWPTTNALRLTARTRNGSSFNNTTNLQAADLLPTLVSPPRNVTVTPGATARFVVSAFGSEPMTYQWLKGGSPLTDNDKIHGATSAMLTLADAQSVDEGNYAVKLSNVLGSLTSPAAVLTVQGPTIRGFSFQPNGQFHLQWNGTAGATYSVLVSSDLVNWQARGTGTETLPGFFEFTDVDGASAQTRFYKLTSP